MNPQLSVDFPIEAIADALAAKVLTRLRTNNRSLPRLLTVEEAGKYIGRTESAMRHLIHTGVIPIVRLDGRVQMDRSDLDHLIDSAKQ